MQVRVARSALESVFRSTSKTLRYLQRKTPGLYNQNWVLDGRLRHLVYGVNGILNYVPLTAGMRVLELGPGSGALSAEASRRIGCTGELHCIDLRYEMAASVRARGTTCHGASPVVVVGDGLALPYSPDIFDLAFLVAVLGEIDSQQQALTELHRVLKPGGVLSVAELLADPDYLPEQVLLALGQRVGFQLGGRRDNLLSYVINFFKP